MIRAGALGDVLFGVPALGALRASLPAASIHLVAPLSQAQLVRAAHIVDTVSDVGDAALSRLFDDGPTAEELPAFLRDLDVAVVWLRRHEAVQARLEQGGARCVVAASPFPSTSRTHAADWLLASLAPLGVRSDGGWERSAWLSIGAPERAWARDWARTHVGDAPYAVLHPGSGSPRKNWPACEWATVVSELVTKHHVHAVVSAGPADTQALAEVVRTAGEWPALRDRVTILQGASLPRLAAVLAQSSIYLGNDSGVSHLAAASAAPTLAVFGPTDPSIWRPRGPRVRVLGGAAVAPAPDGSYPIIGEKAAWPKRDEVVTAAEELLSSAGTGARPNRAAGLGR